MSRGDEQPTSGFGDRMRAVVMSRPEDSSPQCASSHLAPTFSVPSSDVPWVSEGCSG